MTEPAATTDAAPATVKVSSVIEVLSGQLSSLQTLVSTLETSVSQNLCTCEPLPAGAVQTIQRIDYLRQSLKDVCAILAYLGSAGSAGATIPTQDLVDLVDMRDSLKGLVGPGRRQNNGQCHDIWL